jgi:hypothetical protein
VSWRSNHRSDRKKDITHIATLIKEANERILDAAILEEKSKSVLKKPQEDSNTIILSSKVLWGDKSQEQYF